MMLLQGSEPKSPRPQGHDCLTKTMPVLSPSLPHTNVSTKRRFKKDILNRMGGKAVFEISMVNLCTRVREDPTLSPIFDDLCWSQFLRLHSGVFYHTFLEPTNDEALNRQYKKLYKMQQQGIKEYHFLLILHHFVCALKSLGMQQDIITDIVTVAAPFRRAFSGDNNTGRAAMVKGPEKDNREQS